MSTCLQWPLAGSVESAGLVAPVAGLAAPAEAGLLAGAVFGSAVLVSAVPGTAVPAWSTGTEATVLPWLKVLLTTERVNLSGHIAQYQPPSKLPILVSSHQT